MVMTRPPLYHPNSGLIIVLFLAYNLVYNRRFLPVCYHWYVASSLQSASLPRVSLIFIPIIFLQAIAT